MKFNSNIANLDLSHIRNNYFVHMPTYSGIEILSYFTFPDLKAIVNDATIPCTEKNCPEKIFTINTPSQRGSRVVWKNSEFLVSQRLAVKSWIHIYGCATLECNLSFRNFSFPNCEKKQ